MEKIDTFRMRVRPGRKYMYGDNEFVVKDLTMIKMNNSSSETWKPAVAYYNTDASKGQQVTFTRSLEDFLSKFIPEMLEVGDFVEAVSMGKSRGFFEVSEIKDGVAHYKDSDLQTFTAIDVKTLRVNVINPAQATDYYLLIPQETASDYYRMVDEIIRKVAQLNCVIDVGSMDSVEKRQKARATIKKLFEVVNNTK